MTIWALAFLSSMGLYQTGNLCQKWSPHYQVGKLNSSVINEASGLAISNQHTNRLYHINDSGDGPNFYITDEKGGQTQTIEVDDFDPEDTEDLAYGPCGKKQCLVIGDIGDNSERREEVQFIFIEESAQYSAPVTPMKIVRAEYPDRAHNAEGIALHPDGSLYLVTKETNATAEVFRLSPSQLIEGPVQTLQYVGEIDLSDIAKGYDKGGKIITSFDIAPDGSRVLLLTYQNAIEISMTRSESVGDGWVTSNNFQTITTAELRQTEAIAYLPNGKGFLYTTETGFLSSKAPVMRSDCVE